MKQYRTIIRSVATEKSARAQERGKYTFLVNRAATKVDVKLAVKALYGVDVASVNMKINPKKTRLYGRRRVLVKRPIQKVAVVTLKAKQSIDPGKILDSKTKKAAAKATAK